jgi:hypothetical protein
MHVHAPELASVSLGVFSAAAIRLRRARPPAIPPTAGVVWIGLAPPDEDARVVWEVLVGREPRTYRALLAVLSDRLLRRDLARVGGLVDLGFLRPLYWAYARDIVRRLAGSQVRIGGPVAP